MNVTQLRAFDAVARDGSFSRAAQRLGLTQPALTIQVKALEATYGVRLLDRSGRSVTLTDAGQTLLELTRRFFEVEDEIRELLTASQELQRGLLRVAADGPHIVMGMFAMFRERHPGVELSVTLGNTALVRQQLVERRVDIGILPGIADDPAFDSVRLWRHSPVLIVPPGHPWAGRASVTVAELDGQPMLMREAGSNTQRQMTAALQRAGSTPRTVLELGSREAILGAVAAGLGLGVVWKIEAAGDSRFCMIDIDDPDISSIDYVACLRSESNRRIVRAMMALAAQIGTSGQLPVPHQE